MTVQKKLLFCFTFSLSLYNDLKVLKTGGQPLLKFILRNLSKHSLNFSPWKKKTLLTYNYPDNGNNMFFNFNMHIRIFKTKGRNCKSYNLFHSSAVILTYQIRSLMAIFLAPVPWDI